MKLLGLSHVLLCAANIAEARVFYVSVLGFEVLEEDPEHTPLTFTRSRGKQI